MKINILGEYSKNFLLTLLFFPLVILGVVNEYVFNKEMNENILKITENFINETNNAVSTLDISIKNLFVYKSIELFILYSVIVIFNVYIWKITYRKINYKRIFKGSIYYIVYSILNLLFLYIHLYIGNVNIISIYEEFILVLNIMMLMAIILYMSTTFNKKFILKFTKFELKFLSKKIFSIIAILFLGMVSFIVLMIFFTKIFLIFWDIKIGTNIYYNYLIIQNSIVFTFFKIYSYIFLIRFIFTSYTIYIHYRIIKEAS